MNAIEKIKELENEKSQMLAFLMQANPSKEDMTNICDNVRAINFTIRHLQDIDVDVEEKELEDLLDVDAIIEDSRNDGGHHTMGETTYGIQRRLVTKLEMLKNKNNATKVITNGNLASVLQDVAGYTLNPVNVGRVNNIDPNVPYPIGTIGGLDIYVDARQRWDDNRIVMYSGEDEVSTLKVKDTNGVLV